MSGWQQPSGNGFAHDSSASSGSSTMLCLTCGFYRTVEEIFDCFRQNHNVRGIREFEDGAMQHAMQSRIPSVSSNHTGWMFIPQPITHDSFSSNRYSYASSSSQSYPNFGQGGMHPSLQSCLSSTGGSYGEALISPNSLAGDTGHTHRFSFGSSVNNSSHLRSPGLDPTDYVLDSTTFSADIDMEGDIFSMDAVPYTDTGPPLHAYPPTLDVPDNGQTVPCGGGKGRVGLTPTQEEDLQRYSERWAARTFLPSEAEINGLAAITYLDPEFVRTWYNHFRQHWMPPDAARVTAASDTSSALTELPQEAQVLTRTPSGRLSCATYAKPSKTVSEVQAWARARFWRACTSHQSLNAPTDLLFRCTLPGCQYSTNERDAWQRHEQNWQPQEFWHCVVCRAQSQGPSICHRKDKVWDHFNAAHPHIDRTKWEALRNDSEVAINAGFERNCKFVNALGIPCSYVFKDWDDRVKHYLAHFNKRIRDGPWELRPGRHRWFEDDDQDNTGASGSSASGHSGSAPQQKGRASYKQSTTSRRQKGRTQQSTTRAQGHDGSITPSAIKTPLTEHATFGDAGLLVPCVTRPHSLLDVEHLCLVNDPGDVRYLAFDHTRQQGTLYSVSTLLSAIHFDHPDLRIRVELLPAAFKDAVALTRDLGHKYLWIAELCELQGRNVPPRHILEHAALVIVRVAAKPSNCDEIDEDAIYSYQFVCHYRNVDQIFSWREENGPFIPLRNLGHGTYGIVDEVQLRYGGETFARKELQISRYHPKARALTLREIDTLQRLDHPHVPHFVAAYYKQERRSWNILMTPVAQINLRDFLADPQRWPKKRKSLIKWFACLASAVEYLHGVSCRHKDIKPANILINKNDILLSDFGTSHHFETNLDEPGRSRYYEQSLDDSSTIGDGIMTPKYCAPEVAAKKKRGRKADIYSLGCVFAEMLTVELGSSLTELAGFLTMYDRGKARYATYHERLPDLHAWLERLTASAGTAYHMKLLSICKAMLAFTPASRPSATTVLRELCEGKHVAGETPLDWCPCCYRMTKTELDTFRMPLPNIHKHGAQLWQPKGRSMHFPDMRPQSSSVVLQISMPGFSGVTWVSVEWRWPRLKTFATMTTVQSMISSVTRYLTPAVKGSSGMALCQAGVYRPPDQAVLDCRKMYGSVVNALSQVFSWRQSTRMVEDGITTKASLTTRNGLRNAAASVAACLEPELVVMLLWLVSYHVGMTLPRHVGFNGSALALGMIKHVPHTGGGSITTSMLGDVDGVDRLNAMDEDCELPVCEPTHANGNDATHCTPPQTDAERILSDVDIDLGDLGTINVSTLLSILRKHKRCTCCCSLHPQEAATSMRNGVVCQCSLAGGCSLPSAMINLGFDECSTNTFTTVNLTERDDTAELSKSIFEICADFDFGGFDMW
ncbi:hypothetical protein BAUCODRAFT_36371 [Baudoinia panamericana UAMH 10762]|uniref:Protein kinase domain-containing protein n=1 Tax=Baudoinia panamericana (strain UAMH 10762) TaxID=717646 RepID=M2MR20_BAUPA|nr:uncharacterized protein BAUCODRAFT_36371 [Baudoinia panamericana UAMH 10762]EMC93918.1 hypothetical protein BAUCODRAFT_36371 [Baudoinia panamericana UAMH 10762]